MNKPNHSLRIRADSKKHISVMLILQFIISFVTSSIFAVSSR